MTGNNQVSDFFKQHTQLGNNRELSKALRELFTKITGGENVCLKNVM